MPYTVAYSFTEFLENISLTGDHEAIATARKDRIVSLLSKSFTILDAFETGSIPRGTALKARADLDVMVALHWTKHIKGKSPAAVLQGVRGALGQYRTNVRKNGQAVTLHYESWPNVDIVPVSRVRGDNGRVSYYSVPDANSARWIKSRPRTHTNAIEARVADCGENFKALIRMIKQWNEAHSSLMTSYHIEVLCLKIFESELSDFSWHVYKFFDAAVKLVAAPLEHAGSITDEYLEDDDARDEVLDRLRSARSRASDAWYLTYGERSGHEEAIRIWRIIFGDRFPAYG